MEKEICHNIDLIKEMIKEVDSKLVGIQLRLRYCYEYSNNKKYLSLSMIVCNIRDIISKINEMLL